ncbi:MAG: hypothetical protein V3T88_04240 [Nitrosomonadaceae bacterium]
MSNPLQRPIALASLWIMTLTFAASVVTVFAKTQSATELNKYRISTLVKEHNKDILQVKKQSEEERKERKALTEAINKLALEVAKITK